MFNRITAAIFGVLGGLSALPFGRELLKNIFWDRVIHFMNPILEPAFQLIQEYSIPAAFFLIALYFGVGRDSLIALVDWSKRKLNWYLVTSIVFGCASIVALALFFWDRSRGPIL